MSEKKEDTKIVPLDANLKRHEARIAELQAEADARLNELGNSDPRWYGIMCRIDEAKRD
jgi:hypothetical protein